MNAGMHEYPRRDGIAIVLASVLRIFSCMLGCVLVRIRVRRKCSQRFVTESCRLSIQGCVFVALYAVVYSVLKHVHCP